MVQVTTLSVLVAQISGLPQTKADEEASVCQTQVCEFSQLYGLEAVSILGKASTGIRGGGVAAAGNGTADVKAEARKPVVTIDGRNILDLGS